MAGDLPSRLAVGATTALVTGFCLIDCAYLVKDAHSAWRLAVGCLVLAANFALQLCHSFPRHVRLPDRSRYATLAAQALLAFVPVLVVGQDLIGMIPLLAASALLVLPQRVAWPVFAAVFAGDLAVVLRVGDSWNIVYLTVEFLLNSLIVFGLSRLTDLVETVHRSRAELTRLAVTTERLRFARDLHDLLGYSLSTITLKCELANRLVPRDTTRAQHELAEILHTSRQALADVRTVARGYRQMSLADEAKAAHSMLTATGIHTTVEVTDTPLPADTDTVLATVLREGLTNVLRHSKAEHCAISTAHTGHAVVLRLANDGASTATAAPSPADQGSGIGNLTTRVSRLGGTLTARHEDGWFHLTARIPLPEPASAGA
ncbi:histidine kinase [Streptomyces sp. ICBB 8177]|uniref:sensor histidine kinase n=1 Tax=Streptomyces sp. ICBB 8177 TaxID=563922 RepID=UPI0011B46C91|nr:histidine kinase [Streptomyces sp. ICBB 8177]